MYKYSSYRSEMVSTDGRTDGRTDRRTDTEGYNIIPRHTLVAGYKKHCGMTVLTMLKIRIKKKGFKAFTYIYYIIDNNLTTHR